MKKSDGSDMTHEDVVAWMEQTHPRTVMSTLDMRVESYDPERVVVAVDVDSRLFQPTGVVHGGIYVLLAETAASIAANLSIDLSKYFALGMEINANHLRPVSQGTIRAIATSLHRGKTSHVYHIDVLDDNDKRLCVSRCTMAVRPHAGGE